MHLSITLVFGFLSAAATVLATPCVVFDSNWNLYAFGAQGQYWNLGTQDAWNSSSSANVTTVSGQNAPPMNGNNTQCFLAEFFNAIYVIDGDSANPTNVHIFDASSATWTVQSVQTEGVDPTVIVAILDHDTNVFYGIQGDQLYQLDMSEQTKATSSAIQWNEVNAVSFNVTGWTPSMGHADNHIYYFDVPGNSAGEADIFVIHYAWWQPTPQAYTPSSGEVFPEGPGKTATLWQSSAGFAVPTQFAFFPDDASGTWIVDVVHNVTSQFAAPQSVVPGTPGTSFAGSTSALVAMGTDAEIYWLPVDQTSLTSGTTASWQKLPNNLWSSTAAASASASATATGSAAKSSNTSSGSSSSSGSKKSGAERASKTDVLRLLAVTLGCVSAAFFLS